MTDANIVIGVKADGTGAKVIKRDLDNIADSGDRAKKSTDLLTKAFAAFVSYQTIQGLTAIADRITVIETTLKNVTNSTAEYNRRFEQLFQIAQRNGDSFQGLVDTFSRLNISVSDAIKNSTDMVKVTELLSRGLAATGANAQLTSAVMTQLSQGLAGNFQSAAQELNSLIEGAPVLAKAIAEQLGGKSAADLKRFAEQGKITSETFLKALLDAESAIKAFEIPPTIARSWQRLANEVIRLGSESKTVEGTIRRFAGAIDFLAENVENLLKLIVAVGVAFLTTFAITNIQLIAGAAAAFLSLAGNVRNLAGAVALLQAAFAPGATLTIGLTGVLSILAGLTTAVFLFRKEILFGLSNVEIFGTSLSDVFFGIKNAAIESFKSLAQILITPFLIAKDSIASIYYQIKSLLGGELTADQSALAGKTLLQIAGSRISDTYNYVGTTRQRINTTTSSDILKLQKEIENSLKKPDLPTIPTISGGTNNAVNGSAVLAHNLKEAAENASDLQKEAVKINEDFDELTRNIESGFKDAFKSAFTESDGGFKKFISGLKSSFTNFISEIAYLAARPIVLNLVAGVAGLSSLGIGSSSASASLGGAAGGGGFFGSLSSLGSSFLNGGLFSNTLGGIGAKVGSLFSGGNLLSSSSFIGSQAFGNLGYGAIGGLAANLLGLGGGLGSTIGGAAGSLLGGGLGASAGTILGFAGGPLGSIAGSFLGSALGGLFGGSQPSLAIDRGFDVQNGRIFQNRAASDEATNDQQSAFDSLSVKITQAANSFLDALGANLTNSFDGFLIAQTRREGIFSDVEGRARQSFSSTEDAINYALKSSFSTAQFTGISDQLAEAIRKSFSASTSFEEGVTKSLQAKQVIDFINGAEVQTVSPLKAAFEALEDQFNSLKNIAIELGLPIEKLTDAYDKQKSIIAGQYLSPLQSFLDSQALSSDSSLNPYQRLSLAREAFDSNLSSIKLGDYTNIGNITNQAGTLLGLGRDIFASGEGFTSLESYVRQSISGIAGDLGAPGALNDSIVREITLSNAQQTSILEQVNLQLQELREENARLRKAMERVGNALVVQQ